MIDKQLKKHPRLQSSNAVVLLQHGGHQLTAYCRLRLVLYSMFSNFKPIAVFQTDSIDKECNQTYQPCLLDEFVVICCYSTFGSTVSETFSA